MSGAVNSLESEHLGTSFRDIYALLPQREAGDILLFQVAHTDIGSDYQEIQAHGDWLQDVF